MTNTFYSKMSLLDTGIQFWGNPELYQYLSSNNCDRSSEDSSDNSSKENNNIPEPPTNCCMSGCPNCVWVEYAEKLSKMFRDGGAKSREIIMSKVTDENMKAFLSMELRLLEKRLKDEKTNGDNPK